MNWYILPPLDVICLNCPLPRCDENNPRCPWRLAKAAGNGSQKKSVREVQVLAYLDSHPDRWFRVCDVISALPIPAPTVTAVLLRLRRGGQVVERGEGRALRLQARH